MPTAIARDLFSALSLVALTHTRSLSGSDKLLEVNSDGSIREQNWREKLANYGSRLIGRYELRKDTKDAAVADALRALAHQASLSPDPVQRESYEQYGTQLDTLGYLGRYRDAKRRIQERAATSIPASGGAVRRDSVASLHAQSVNNPGSTSAPVAEQTPAASVADPAVVATSASAPPSVRDTPEFRDRVTALENAFGVGDTQIYQALVEVRMTALEGSVAKSLSDAQYYALKAYSASAYTEMNAALRDPSGPEAQNPQTILLNELATAGLQKLAQEGFNFTGITNRGVMNYDYFINLLPNQTYTASAFTSTSLRADLAKDIAGASLGGAQDSTVIHTYGNTGVDIASLSEHKYESEILYPPGSQFRVVFTGEHTAEIPGFDATDPPVNKKVSYLVVEEISTPTQKGVSGIVGALDLATPTRRVTPVRSKPLTQADATGPLVGGTLPLEDDDDLPPIDLDELDNR